MHCARVEVAIATGRHAAVTDAQTLEHLLECGRCRTLWLTSALVAGTGAEPEEVRGLCPEREAVVLLFEGPIDPRERCRRLDHAAHCGSCLEEVVALAWDRESLERAELVGPPPDVEAQAASLSGSSPRPATLSAGWLRPRAGHRFALATAAGFALIAVGLGVILVGKEQVGFAPPPGGATLRSTTSGTPRAVAPTGGLPGRDALRFVWEAGSEAGARSLASRYHLVVVDLESGLTVMDARTTETSYVPTSEEVGRLRPGARYHWLVDPLGGGAGGPSAPEVFWLARE